ncbi:hypothetical protein EVAR_22299_1 [Eumeta japonica]|uniref:Uncharacterized protein n=1 Tax=Eumeta variegata TaxID=151549 RepID=A0A4C1UAU4_EUMVA|nr:hypothetical protein EVAR_22299_1 [Eumeta japonica]
MKHTTDTLLGKSEFDEGHKESRIAGVIRMCTRATGQRKRSAAAETDSRGRTAAALRGRRCIGPDVWPAAGGRPSPSLICIGIGGREASISLRAASSPPAASLR